MKIKPKLVLYLLAISLVPLLITMSLTLVYTSKKIEGIALKAAQERVELSAEKLSAYFSSRISEIQTYTQTPLLTSMKWPPVREFLRKEIVRHDGVYEKFILSDPSSHFRNTLVGNPAKDGYASFDDSDPRATLKSIRKRGYWQKLVGNNKNSEALIHVSNPMISYTTGVKQVVVGSSILSQDGKLLGMLGGGIAWKEIEKTINTIRNSVAKDFGSEVKLSVIDSDGTYIYHWYPEKVVHLKRDHNGQAIINDIGEKTVHISKVSDEQEIELVNAGKALLSGGHGYVTYNSIEHNEEMIAIYAPVSAAGYGLMLSIPKSVILIPVSNLQYYFGVLLLLVALIVLFLAVYTSRHVLKRVFTLNKASKVFATGDYETRIEMIGQDEISELASTLNTMAGKLKERERTLIEERIKSEAVLNHLNIELEDKVQQRTAAILSAKEQLSDFKDAIDQHSIVSITDLEGNITFVNEKFCQVSGYSEEELIGKNHRILNSGNQGSGYWSNMFKIISSGQTWNDEVRNIAKDGSFYWVKTTIMPSFDFNGNIKNYISIRTDITENKLLNEKISYQASHDELTGLVNRRKFEASLEQLISSTNNNTHCILYLDLDNFKVINDTSGHHAGDELLRQIADLIKKNMRKSDLMARLGGDEFGIILNDCKEEKAKFICTSILENISNYKFCWENRTYKIGVSIGVVVLKEETTNLTEILKSADSACYAAKDRGRNNFVVYNSADNELVNRQDQMNWAAKLTECLADDQFVLYAQPIISVSEENTSLNSYEILIRMTDGDNIIPPNAFLPAAERYNKITEIDKWVVSRTFEMLDAKSEFLKSIDHISINLSGSSLTDVGFKKFLQSEMEKYNLHEKICFEITETAAVTNLSKAGEFINLFHNMGVRFSLDDFGSGLSSFAYLKSLQVDYLKIDGHFVKDMASNPIDRAMVNSIHEVGSVIGKKTIAEFVENDEILSILQEIGVDYAQGYGIGKPVLFSEILDTQKEWLAPVCQLKSVQ